MSILIKEAIVMTAMYYSHQLPPPVLEMFAEDLEDLPELLVVEGYKTYRRNPKNRSMPLPAQIRDIVDPQPTPESGAREAAGKITQAIVKFGYSNPNDARAFMGESAWAVVQSFGGWNFICTSHGVTIDPGQFYAQARERLTDVHREGKSFSHQALSAPEPGEMIEQSNLDKERARQIQELINQGGL